MLKEKSAVTQVKVEQWISKFAHIPELCRKSPLLTLFDHGPRLHPILQMCSHHRRFWPRKLVFKAHFKCVSQFSQGVRLKHSGSYMLSLVWKILSLLSPHLNHASLGLCSGVLSINVGSPNVPFTFGSLIILWKYPNASGYWSLHALSISLAYPCPRTEARVRSARVKPSPTRYSRLETQLSMLAMRR